MERTNPDSSHILSRLAAAVIAAIAVVLFISLLSAAGAALALHGRRGNASTAPSARLYTVTAALLTVKGGPIYACRLLEWSLPPAGCTGVQVEGVDLRAIAGVHDYGDGTLLTPTVKLVGRWGPPMLVLTEPPIPASPATQPHDLSAGTPQSFSSVMPPGAAEVEHKLISDLAFLRGQGILIDAFGWDGTNLDVVLVEGSRSTADYLTSRYGPIKIEAWLQPL